MRANQIIARITSDFKMDVINNLISTDFTPVSILRAFKLLLSSFFLIFDEWFWLFLLLIKYLFYYHNVLLADSERSFAVSEQVVTSMPLL